MTYLPFASVQEFLLVVSFVVEAALSTPTLKLSRPVNKQHGQHLNFPLEETKQLSYVTH